MSATVPRCKSCARTMHAINYHADEVIGKDRRRYPVRPRVCLVCPRCDSPDGSGDAPVAPKPLD